MYSDLFCRVYNEFGWNVYPEVFGDQVLEYLAARDFRPRSALDLACGTGVLCGIFRQKGIRARGMDFSAGMIDIARQENPGIPFDVADMVTYRPEEAFDLVTCTGDALNHIERIEDVAEIFRNVHGYLAPGGYFIFDLLDEGEISDGEPFEADWKDRQRIRFRMTRPGENRVNLQIRVYEEDRLQFEENIRETLHSPRQICRLLGDRGFRVVRCADRLLDDREHGTTWFVVARRE